MAVIGDFQRDELSVGASSIACILVSILVVNGGGDILASGTGVAASSCAGEAGGVAAITGVGVGVGPVGAGT